MANIIEEVLEIKNFQVFEIKNFQTFLETRTSPAEFQDNTYNR